MRWKKQKNKNREAIREHIAVQVASVIIALQTRTARMLHRWEQRLSQRQKKILLILFVACCSLYLGGVLVGVLTGDETNSTDIRAVGSGIPPTNIPPQLLPQRDTTATEFFKH